MAFDSYSKYYDLLYADKDYSGEAAYVQKLLTLHQFKGGRILEVGCGTGLHAGCLAGPGIAITGIDLSAGMIASAQLRHQGRSDLDFHVASSLDFQFSNRFDAAVSLFHVMSYHTSNEIVLGALRNISAHLKVGAPFVFDFWHGPGVLADPPKVRVKRMEGLGCKVLRIAEPTVDFSANTVRVDFEVHVEELATGEREKIIEKHPMRYFFKPELELLLENAGLKLEGWYPWMETTGCPSDQNWYAVAVGKKVENR